MTPLAKILAEEIAAHGPMPFGRFMDACLFHPQHGYYNTHDPLKDFATSPEISQLFGEMLGLWCVDAWQKMGQPARFTLLECGPGRGTLMADILRTVKLATGFIESADIVLLERSPKLHAMQKEKLAGHKVRWIADIAELPAQPTLMVCNEFFDAFPIRREVKTAQGWVEQCVTCVGQTFIFTAQGETREIQDASNDWFRHFTAHLAQHRGAALVIDYGYDGAQRMDTAQAIHAKQKCSVFEHIGLADITAHVNFAPLCAIAKTAGLHCGPLLTQGEFLKTYGIEQRAEKLAAKASPEQKMEIHTALQRLTSPQQMGTLFKVMCVMDKNTDMPVGFE